MSLTIILSGCHWDPYEGDYTRSKVQIKDLVGTWVPDAGTVKDMSDRGGYKKRRCRIILRSDGIYSVTNMPDWVFDIAGESHGKFKSESGHWTLEQYDGRDDLGARIYFRSNFHSMCGALRSQSPPYNIYFILGDGDEGNAAVFFRLEDKRG